jgi:hypothetical protein
VDPESVCAILNELLAAEQRAIAPRLFESTVFVSRPSVAEYPVVLRIAKQARRNCEWLTQKVVEHRGVPAPRSPVANMANWHFQELHHVLPMVVADQEALVRTYKAAAQRLASEPNAVESVDRILDIHLRELDALRQLLDIATGRAAPASTG